MALVPVQLSQDDDYIQFSLFDRGNNVIPIADNDNNKQLFKAVMPKLSSSLGQINGVKGPVTLSDMREVSFETLFIILNQFIPSSGPWITKPSVNKYKIGSYTTGNIDDLKKKFGISRKELKDSNLAVADVTMIKILEQLCIKAASYTGSGAPAAVAVATSEKNKILAAISCFALSLNVKEVLDMSQLYALIRPVVEYNITNGHSGNNLSQRVTNIATINAANAGELKTEIDAVYNQVQLKVAMYPLLESADGAAARICGTLLPCITESSLGTGVSQTFEITTQDVFYIAALLNMSNLPDFSDISQVDQNTLIKLIRLLKMIPQVNVTKNTTQFVIDVVYYFYSNSITRGAARDTIMDYLKQKINRNMPHKIYTILPKWICDAINSAYFLNLFERAPGASVAPGAPPASPDQNKEAKIKYIEQQLVLYLWDSQCHDNKDCSYFRILCVLMFLMKIDGPLDVNIFDEMFPTLQLSSNDNLDRKIKFYESAFVEKFSEIGSLNETVFRLLFNETAPPANPTDNYKRKKILFYLLSCKTYSDIETLLYVRLSKKSCYLFLQGQPIGQNDDINQHVQNVIILRNTFGPAEQIETLQLIPEIYINPCYYPLNAILAVDLPVHFSSTLINLSTITRLDDDNSSKLVVSSATRNDAASQREPLSTNYINGSRILDGPAASAAALAPGAAPIQIQMPLFLSRGFFPDAKAGFIIISPNVKPNSKDVLFTYPSTNISCDNVLNKRIYLDTYLTNFVTSDVVVKKRFGEDLFTIMALKFYQILGIEGGHYPTENNASGTQANGYFVNGIWSYKPIVENEPNNYYDNIIRDCIQYDIDRSIGLPNNQKPLHIFLEIFRPLIRIVKEKYLDKTTKPSIPKLNLNVIFRTIADNLNTFFISEFRVGTTIQVPLPMAEANIKFCIFHGYLEFILSPWIDERECRVLDYEIDYQGNEIMAGGGEKRKKTTEPAELAELAELVTNREEDPSREIQRQGQIEEMEMERLAVEARQIATTAVTSYIQLVGPTQVAGNPTNQVIGSYGIFLYKDGLISIKTKKQYNAVLSLINCAEGYNPFYVDAQAVALGQGQRMDLVQSPKNRSNISKIVLTPNTKRQLDLITEAAAAKYTAYKLNNRLRPYVSGETPSEDTSGNNKKLRGIYDTFSIQNVTNKVISNEDSNNPKRSMDDSGIVYNSTENQSKRNRNNLGGKRSTRKYKYSKRNPIRRKPIKRKTIKKRIHKRKTRKNI